MKFRVVIALVFAAATTAASAQQKFIAPVEEPEMITLRQGESFVNNLDKAYVFNMAAMRNLDGKIQQLTAINKILEEEKATIGQIRNDYDALAAKYKELNDIQEKSFADLLKKQLETAELAKEATVNTEKALSYAAKVRNMSYVTGGIVGGVAGGLIDNGKGSFGLLGAAVGTGAGVLLTFVVQAITGR
jgi:hypothetical protein